MHRKSVIVVAALGLAAAQPAARAAEPSPAAPSAAAAAIAGVWRLDAARSEDALAKMRAQMEQAGARGSEHGGRAGEPGGPGEGGGGFGGGRTGFGGGMGGRRRGGAMGGGPGMGPGRREALEDVLAAPQSIAVTVGPDEIEIAGGDGPVRHLRPNGQKMKHEGGPVTETRTRWEGNGLVTESWLGGGRTHVVETLARDAASGELRSTIKIETMRFQPATAVRVYLPAGAAATPAPDGAP